MKRVIRSNTEYVVSGCSFDFDLGDDYRTGYIESKLDAIFDQFGLTIEGVDFRSVEYPNDRVYSQCGIDFSWWEDHPYNARAIEDAIENMIEDEGGNFFGIDFYSLD